MPGTYTKPLQEPMVSDGPKLRKFVSLFFKTDDGKPLVLDCWQAWVIDHALERYPDDWPVEKLRGRLRYRQVVISMGRQNGKSVLGAVLGMYGLMMHEAGPYVLSLASNADQATIIYNRVKFAIDSHPALRRRFKTTGTRGIRRLDKPGTYKVKPAKGDALQGIPVSLCLYDEIHITPPEMWSAVVMGTTAMDDGLVLGITTAGDDNSLLLKDLYKQGRSAASGEGSERFGFFLWEAQAGAEIDDPEALLDANPALVAGRLDMDTIINDVRSIPEHDARRYRLNQFVSAEGSWMPMTLWYKHMGDAVKPGAERPVFSIDRTPSWEHATITATVKRDGILHTKVIASFNKPNREWLLNVCLKLAKHNPQRFVMDGYTLGDLGKELERRGLPVKVLRQNDVTNACATAYSLIANGKVQHANDPLLNSQMPFAVRKNVGEAWRINRTASTVNIDAVLSMVFGLYTTETLPEDSLQLF